MTINEHAEQNTLYVAFNDTSVANTPKLPVSEIKDEDKQDVAETPVTTNEAQTLPPPPAAEVKTTELSTTPLSTKVVDNVDKKPKHRGLKVAAGAALAGIIGIGAIGASKVIIENEKESSPNPKQKETTLTTETPTTVSPEADTTTGNIRIGRILPTDTFTSVTLDNGDIIRVPKLRSGSTDPNLFAESALANLSCYMTTGNEGCLKEFSTYPGVQEILRNNREFYVTPIKLSNPVTGKNAQFAIFDNPENPATFVRGKDKYGPYIKLSSGDLYLNVYWGDKETWQGPKTHTSDTSQPYTAYFVDLIMYIDERGGKTIINGLTWTPD